jgi:hypothetical protein
MNALFLRILTLHWCPEKLGILSSEYGRTNVDATNLMSRINTLGW